MSNPFIATLQNKISMKSRPKKLSKFQLALLSKQGGEKQIMENLMNLLQMDTEYQGIYVTEAKQLIDYQVFTETRNYLEEVLPNCDQPEQAGQVYYLIARCCHGLGSLDEALVFIDQALEQYPNNHEFYNLQADCFLELGEWEAAIKALHKSLRSSPEDDQILYRLGSIFLFHGEFGEALNCFSGCCKLKPYHPHYWEMKGEMLLKLNQLTAACTCFQKAINYNGHLQINSRLAYCYAKTGQLKKAKKLLLKVLTNDADDYDALCNLAGIYHKLKQNDQAYRLLKKAYTINCNDVLLLNNLAFICHQLGRTRKAVEYYHAALKMNPADKIVLYNLGVSLVTKGYWDEAKDAIEKLVSLDSTNTQAWALLGNIYERLSQHSLAVDCYNRSLKLVL